MIRICIILFALSLLFACGSSNNSEEQKPLEQVIDEQKIGTDTSEAFYVVNANKFEYSTIFPFSDAAYIEILSYPNRLKWDTTSDGKHTDYFHPHLIKNGKLNFDTTGIKERILLNSEKQKKLFNILYNNTCLAQQMSPCY